MYHVWTMERQRRWWCPRLACLRKSAVSATCTHFRATSSPVLLRACLLTPSSIYSSGLRSSHLIPSLHRHYPPILELRLSPTSSFKTLVSQGSGACRSIRHRCFNPIATSSHIFWAMIASKSKAHNYIEQRFHSVESVPWHRPQSRKANTKTKKDLI
jgi:hypothetical protein